MPFTRPFDPLARIEEGLLRAGDVRQYGQPVGQA